MSGEECISDLTFYKLASYSNFRDMPVVGGHENAIAALLRKLETREGGKASMFLELNFVLYTHFAPNCFLSLGSLVDSKVLVMSVVDSNC